MNKLNNVHVIHSIHFHAHFSSREGRGGSSPRRTRNTSRSIVVSDSSAGSTQTRDQARPDMYNIHTPRPWMTSEPLFRGFSQLDLPCQSFLGEFWTHGRNRYIDICALSFPRRRDSTFRALRIPQLRTLSRSVTPRTHHKSPSLLRVLEMLFRSLPKIQDHR